MPTSSLSPRTESYGSARTRGTSQFDFKTATTGVAAKAMRNEISQLVHTVDDPATKKVIQTLSLSLFFF
jgi:UTP--glucose-1-phosphate uridylyltransferase